MFLETSIISIIIAKFRRGKFKNLESIEIKAWYLLFLAALIQLLLTFFKINDFSLMNISFENYFFYMHALSYILIILCVLLNIKKFYMKFFLIGVILNFLVIFSNGGQMPVDLNKIESLHIEDKLNIDEFDIKHKPIDKDTRLKSLSDIILISPPYPLPEILSIGDVFLMIGMFVFFQKEMIRKDQPKEKHLI